jgi:hypothetical protein
MAQKSVRNGISTTNCRLRLFNSPCAYHRHSPVPRWDTAEGLGLQEKSSGSVSAGACSAYPRSLHHRCCYFWPEVRDASPDILFPLRVQTALRYCDHLDQQRLSRSHSTAAACGHGHVLSRQSQLRHIAAQSLGRQNPLDSDGQHISSYDSRPSANRELLCHCRSLDRRSAVLYRLAYVARSEAEKTRRGGRFRLVEVVGENRR